MSTTLVTAPSLLPVTLEEVKQHLRIDTHDDNIVLRSLIVAAANVLQKCTYRQFCTAEYNLVSDVFPSGTSFTLQHPPLIDVMGITYIDTDGASQTLASSVYDVDTDSEPGRVALAYNQSWEDIRGDINSVTVNYACGYGETAQESRATPANVEIGDVFELLVAGTSVATFTATAGTVANVTAGLAAAWTASSSTLTNHITASDETTYVKLLADNAGMGFQLTSSTTDGGGNDTQTLTVTMQTAATCNVPDDIKTAIKLLVEFWYGSPGDTSKMLDVKIPMQIEAIIWSNKVVEYA